MFSFIAKIEGFFTAKNTAAIVADIAPASSILLTILHAFGLAGPHVTKIIQDVANAAASTGSNADKLAAVSAGVVTLAGDVGLPHLAAVAPAIAETAYQLYKAEGSPAIVPAA